MSQSSSRWPPVSVRHASLSGLGSSRDREQQWRFPRNRKRHGWMPGTTGDCTRQLISPTSEVRVSNFYRPICSAKGPGLRAWWLPYACRHTPTGMENRGFRCHGSFGGPTEAEAPTKRATSEGHWGNRREPGASSWPIRCEQPDIRAASFSAKTSSTVITAFRPSALLSRVLFLQLTRVPCCAPDPRSDRI